MSQDEQAELFRVLYDEMHRVAVRMMRRRRPGHTLQPTALVHEALIRLIAGGLVKRDADRRMLLGIAVKAMGVSWSTTTAGGSPVARRRLGPPPSRRGTGPLRKREKLPFIDLHEALEELAALEPRQSLVVTLRYFLGMTSQEVADVLGNSLSTVEADWRLARAWLAVRLREEGSR